MENNLTRHFIRFGIIYALIQIIITVASYMAGVNFIASNMILFSVLMLLLTVGYTTYSIIQFRKSAGGFMTLKEGFMVTFFTLAVGGLITTAFTIILYNFIDKEYPQLLAEKSIQKTAEMMESFGASQDDIDKAMEKTGDVAERFTVFGQIRGYLYGLIFYAIYSVILGAIFKRTKPPFEEQVS